MQQMIGVPAQHAEQVRAIARARGKRIADLIGEFVDANIKAGVIPPDIPGMQIKKKDNKVNIDFGGVIRAFTEQEAKNLATSLKDILTPGPKNPFMPASGFSVVNGGNRGVELRDGLTGQKLVIAPGVARSLANWIGGVVRE